MTTCFQLFKLHGVVTFLEGTFSSKEKAVTAMQSYPLNPEDELQVEEWPVDELATKFNVHVVATRSVD